MKLKNSLKYVAGPTKIFMTALILLIAVVILQAIIIQTAVILTIPKRRSTIKEPKVELSEEEKHLKKLRNSAKQFLPDGTIHLVYPLGLKPGRLDEPEKEEIYDANGMLIWSGLIKDRTYEYLSWARPLRGYRERFDEIRMKQIQMITPELSRSLQIPVRAKEKTEQIWRYDPTGKFFVGYHVDGGKIGFLGSTGFTDSKSRAKPFGRFKLFTAWCPQESLNPTLLWQTSRRVYEINFEKQQVQLIFESEKANIKQISLHKWRDILPETPLDSNIPYRPLIKCLTEDNKHHLIMKNPDQKVTVPVDDDWWNKTLSFTATTQDIFLMRPEVERRPPEDHLKSPKLIGEWLRKFEGKQYKKWIELYRVDNQGNLNKLNHYDWTYTIRIGSSIQESQTWEKTMRYVCQFSSPLYDLSWYLLGGETWVYSYRNNFLISDFAQIVAELRPGNKIFNWVLGLAMVGFAFWHGRPRQTSRGKLIFWLAFTLVFNLAGLLTYLALNHTPIIKCSACGKSRGLAQVNCARCGAELPAPQRRKLDLILNT